MSLPKKTFASNLLDYNRLRLGTSFVTCGGWPFPSPSSGALSQEAWRAGIDLKRFLLRWGTVDEEYSSPIAGLDDCNCHACMDLGTCAGGEKNCGG